LSYTVELHTVGSSFRYLYLKPFFVNRCPFRCVLYRCRWAIMGYQKCSKPNQTCGLTH